MSSLYWSQEVGNRVAGMPPMDRMVARPDGVYERVLTVSVGTDTAAGIVCVSLAIDELGDGPGPYPVILGLYPLKHQMHAQEDALLIARKLGWRLRRATPEVGWQWVRTEADMPVSERSELIIGG